MAVNEVYHDAEFLSVVCTKPDAPDAGDPVRVGNMTGVALTDERTDGYTSVDFGTRVWDLSVTDTGGGGIAIGDTLFIDANCTLIDDTSSGYFFGFALETIGAGLTDTIKVLHVASPGSGTLGAGTVGTANLAADAVTAAKLADDAVVTANIVALNVTAAKIAADILTGDKVANVANANIDGGIPVLHRINIAAGAIGDTDVVLNDKTRVIDAWLVLTGAGVESTTLQVKNGANAITDAMAASGSDTALVRAATINDANHEIAAGGTLRVTSATGATQPNAVVYVLGVKVA